jgi:hypothetical protein
MGLLALGSVPTGAATPVTATQHELAAAQAVRIPLDHGSTALVYWLDNATGADVVTTIDTPVHDHDGAADHSLVRFEASLRPDQSERVSVPATIEQQRLGRQKILQILRRGDHVDVSVEAAAAF